MAERNKSSDLQPAFKADEVDHAILALLSEDARLPAVAIAESLDLSGTAVRRRLTRLQEAGVLGGIRVNRRALGRPVVEAFVAVDLVNGNTALLERLVANDPAVLSAAILLDNPDAILHIGGSDFPAIQETFTSLRGSGAVSSARLMPIVGTIPPES